MQNASFWSSGWKTTRWGDISVQVAPIRVFLLDQVEFPDSVHLTNVLFASTGRVHVLLPFEINQLIDGVLTSDAADEVAFVVEDAIGEVGGYSYI